MLIKMLRNGSVSGIRFKNGDTIDLSESVLKALPESEYEVLATMEEPKAEEKAIEEPKADKKIKKASNK